MMGPLEQALTGAARVLGVFGWPVAHSLSPAMHNAALRALGLDWVYVPFAVRPERLMEAVAGVRALGLVGVNVTIPHKEAIARLVDALTPEAEAIGAVNTVVVGDDGALTGHNTDAAGFRRALAEGGGEVSWPTLLLGAGGAARAVLYALLDAGAEVVVLNRSVRRAEGLAEALAGRGPGRVLRVGVLDAAALVREADRARLVVNATSLGMWPQVEASPWPEELSFPAHALLYDLVFNPRETRLVLQARRVGARALDGLGMLVHQGAEALERWTGRPAPTAVMRAAAEAALSRAHARGD